MRLNAEQLRKLEEERARGVRREVKRNPLYFILENIYDTYNIGGLFRLADALAVEKIYLVGEIETPPNSRIKKASIGTYKIVPWEYKKTVKEAIESIAHEAKRKTYKKDEKNTSHLSHFTPHVVAVEQHPQALIYTKAIYSFPLALIFGNESFGITPETLKLADQIVEIPMFGINKSLNVIVSAAIVSYHAISTYEV